MKSSHKYSTKLVKELCEILASGKHSIEDSCTKVGITRMTFYNWKKSKPKFLKAVEEAEAERLEQYKEMAISGLAKLLDMHEYEEVTTEYENDKKGNPKVKSQKRVKKKIMPNPAAVIFTLTNRDNENWKNRLNTDLTTKGESLNKGFGDFLKEVAIKKKDG